MIRAALAVLVLILTPGVAVAQAFTSDRITVEVRGATGPDVVLIHGLGSSPQVWRRVADRLDDDHRVHLVGLRGFATADPGANAEGALSEPVAAEVARYIAWRRMPPPAVVGHSLGGQIALRVALRGAAGRVMVLETLPFFSVALNPRIRSDDMLGIAELARATILFIGDAAFRAGGGPVVDGLGRAGDGMLAALGVGFGGDRRVLAQGVYEVLTEDLRPSLRRVTVPVTVLYAWNPEMRITQEQSDTLWRESFDGLPGVRFERVDEAAHMLMYDQPARLEEALERFFAR